MPAIYDIIIFLLLHPNHWIFKLTTQVFTTVTGSDTLQIPGG